MSKISQCINIYQKYTKQTQNIIMRAHENSLHSHSNIVKTTVWQIIIDHVGNIMHEHKKKIHKTKLKHKNKFKVMPSLENSLHSH